MIPLSPVHVLDLFEGERAALLALLAALDRAQWDAITVCDPWTVKDVAAHIVADDLGVVAWRKHDWAPARFTTPSWDELLALIGAQNATWVEAMRRLAPEQIIALLRFSGPPLFAHFRTLDLSAMGGPVDWAGPQPAPVWLDVAREYTERWLHQQQIRDAVGAPGLYEPRLFAPVLTTFVRALPHTYRDIAAANGTHVRLVIEGAAGGAWSLVRGDDAWSLYADADSAPTASVTLAQDRAWRLFTKGIAPEDARARIEGDATLGAVALGMVSILA